MNKKELCENILRYGSQQYKKGYDAGREDAKKILKADVLKKMQEAYDKGVADGKNEAFEIIKDRIKWSKD